MNKILKHKKLIVQIIIILTLFISLCIGVVTQADTGFHEVGGWFISANNEELWKDTSGGLAVNNKDWPFNWQTRTTGSTVNKVGFDVIYGSSKSIVQYMGEIPYYETHDADDNARSKISKLPWQKGTSIKTNVNPNNNNNTGTAATVLTVADYWGYVDSLNVIATAESDGNRIYNAYSNFGEDALYIIPRSSLEKVNQNEVVSLRLFALQNVGGSWFLFIYSCT